MIDKLILKYLDDTINSEELSQLYKLLEKPKNQIVFKNYIRYNHDIDLTLTPVNLQKDFKIIKTRIADKKTSKNLISPLLKYAAIILFIIGLGYFYHQIKPFDSQADYANVSEHNYITIEKQNGEIVKFIVGESRKITNLSGDVIGGIEDGQLILKDNSSTKANAFHALTVPYGHKFKLTLADGTRIHLNSGSSLRYPLVFNKKERKVNLEGEAFFKVAPNEDAPFIVESKGLFSKVLGTEFNYSAYPDDKSTDVVLIEGSVGVGLKTNLKGENSYQILAPSQKATRFLSEDKIEVEEVDTKKYIAWTQGSLVFEDEDMKSILRVLQRHYNVEVINKYPDLENYRFSGVFKKVGIEEVLKTIQTHTPFNFNITDNKVTIEPLTTH